MEVSGASESASKTECSHLGFSDQINWHFINGTRPKGHVKRQWTPKEFADVIGISQRQLNNWRRGKHTPISTTDIERIFFGNDDTYMLHYRIALRKAHYFHKFGSNLSDAMFASSINYYPPIRNTDNNSSDIKVLAEAVSSIVDSLKIIRDNTDTLSEIYRLKNKNINLFKSVFRYDHNIHKNKDIFYYSDMLENLNNMIRFRKTIINLIDMALDETNDLFIIDDGFIYEFIFSLYAIERLIEEFYYIKPKIKNLYKQFFHHKMHFYMADTRTAIMIIKRFIIGNRTEPPYDITVFKDKAYRNFIINLRDNMDETIGYICSMRIDE